MLVILYRTNRGLYRIIRTIARTHVYIGQIEAYIEGFTSNCTVLYMGLLNLLSRNPW